MNCKIRLKQEMKRLLVIALLGGSLVAASAAAAKAKRVVLKPKDAGAEIAIVTAGKARSYYPLSARRWSTVSVKGPGELHIVTRAMVAPTAGDMIEYHMVYRLDGAGESVFDAEEVTRSGSARYRDTNFGVPGDPENLTVKVGRGYHSIDLMVKDSLPRVSARYLFAPRKERKTPWVSLAPLAPIEPVDLFAGEETAHYYRFSSEKPMKIEIIGPTDLRVMTRVENSFNMKGRAHYRLQIKQNGQVLQSFQLSSKRSETTIYKNNHKLVPGKAREIVFKVPKGLQRYEITPLDGHSLLGQVMFPRKDAKLGL